MGLIAAGILSGAGLLGLFGSWRNWNRFRRLGTLLGWVLLFLAGVIWARSAASAELGISYALLALTAWAWIFVGYNRQLRPVRDTVLPVASVSLPALSAILKQLLLLVAAVPLAGAAAMVFSTAVATLLPLNQGNALVLAMLLAPLLWGCAAYWQCADSKPMRPAITHLILLAASAALLNFS